MKGAIMAIRATDHRQARGCRVRGSLLMAAAWLALSMLPVYAGTPTMKTTVRLIVTNAQGTVVATMTPQGQVTYTAAYRPYGKQAEGTPKPGPGYTGHVNDPATGLVYMQQRYYDPDGRFISPDPIRPTPGNIYNFNRYAYANNNPIRNIDPDGRSCKKAADSDSYVCTVDSNGAHWSEKQIKQVNTAYTRAVNRLLGHPGRVAHITVGKITFTVTAKQVAKALIGAWVATGTGYPGARAGTLGGGLTPGYGHNGHPKTTLYPNILKRDRSGGTTNIDSDLSRTFIHEGIHETSADAHMLPLYKRDPKNFNNVLHQTPYNNASDWLYGDFQIW